VGQRITILIKAVTNPAAQLASLPINMYRKWTKDSLMDLYIIGHWRFSQVYTTCSYCSGHVWDV